MTAKQKFKVGDRVRLSEQAKKMGVSCYSGGRGKKGERIYTGRVVGFGESEYCVRVLPDGRKTPSAYNLDDWDRDTVLATCYE
jgi:hypothetical protein